MSLTSPANTPAWTAAPTATTSSGLTDWFGSFPVYSLTNCWTAGIRVEPPTNTTSLISFLPRPASDNACSTGFLHLSNKSLESSSNCTLVKVKSKCLGPVASAVMNGRFIFVCITEESSHFAFSAASFNLCIACLSFFKSMPSCFLNSAHNQSMIFWSKSSPPRCVSPEVDKTSWTPSPISKTETSKVPPPRSNTKTFSDFSFSIP